MRRLPLDGAADRRWQSWLMAALRQRGVPDEATLTISMQAAGMFAGDEIRLALVWTEAEIARHAEVVEIVTFRRMVGPGWVGWPAYRAGAKLLRALG